METAVNSVGFSSRQIAAVEDEEQNQPEPAGRTRKPAVVKGTVKPLPNRLCYPDLYAEWKARVDAGGSRGLPRCKRCDGILHWEENHDCPGYMSL